MIKWMLTNKCNRRCNYCITGNVDMKEEMDLRKCFKDLSFFAKTETSIMITGGEPTLSPAFKEKVFMARLLFGDVFLTTANPGVLNRPPRFIKAITFSLHGRNPEMFFVKQSKIPVYASILHNQYYPELPERLRIVNFRGLTINEDQRGTTDFEHELPLTDKRFRYKINRRGHCLEDMIIVMPDMSVTESFGDEYL